MEFILIAAFVWFVLTCFHRAVNGIGTAVDWFVLVLAACALIFTVG